LLFGISANVNVFFFDDTVVCSLWDNSTGTMLPMVGLAAHLVLQGGWDRPDGNQLGHPDCAFVAVSTLSARSRLDAYEMPDNALGFAATM